MSQSGFKITLLGNFSGRNSGDNAILGNLLREVSARFPQARFIIPTLNPGFVKKKFGQYPIEVLGLRPWDGALKIFGIGTLKAMVQTDVILITDNILFDRAFWNPLFNYLSTISLFSGLSRKRGIPIIPYNASLGPFNTPLGLQAMQRILDGTPLIIVRDELSREALAKGRLRHGEIYQGADCAINTPVPSREDLKAVIQKHALFQNPKGTLSFNINPYIDSWLTAKGESGLGRADFTDIISQSLDRLINELGVNILFTTTQTMDFSIVKEVVEKMALAKAVTILGNPEVDYEQITGLLALCGLHVGMRTHSKILAAAAHTPMVTINAYPKSVGFVKTIGMEDWVINLEDLGVEALVDIVTRAWTNRKALQAQMIPRVKEEQQRATSAVEKLAIALEKSGIIKPGSVAA